jgi:hypothetical protein
MDAPACPRADVFARHFVHSQQHRIITYTECRTAVVPKHAAAHLVRNHNRTTKQDRTDIQRYVDGLEDIAHDVSDVRFPGPEDPPYSIIAVQYGGLRCSATGEDGRQCRRVIRTTRMMKAHCEAAHG